MVRQAPAANQPVVELEDDDFDDTDVTTEGGKKKRKPQGPRQMVAIVTVDDEGKVNLEAASYNAATLLKLFGELSRGGRNPQILNIVRS